MWPLLDTKVAKAIMMATVIQRERQIKASPSRLPFFFFTYLFTISEI